MKKVISILLLILFFACTENSKRPIDFYYWRSNYNISAVEKETISNLEVKKLYVRFFDVDKKMVEPVPIGTIKNFDASNLDVEYIPTVFITNRTFLNLKNDDVNKLAQNIDNLITEIAEKGKLNNYTEIQIDCDWTKSTKENYFLFLNQLKNISKKNISATLRLHQVKFKDREGIPPLDKMVLMCYATENPSEVQDKNSILDLNLANDYLNNLEDYPIKLDVALPIYSWAIITNHIGKIKIVNSFDEKRLINQPVKLIGKGIYEVTDDFFLEKFYLSKGFKIKVETVSQNLLNETKIFLNSKLNDEFRFVYFHLDDQFITNYNFTNR